MTAANQPQITVIGGGLSGCEAAWQAARLGVRVELFEMRPGKTTPAHKTDLLAELVCSNSLKSDSIVNASGLLKEELRRLGSVMLAVAEGHRVEAGTALAVDRDNFAGEVQERIEANPSILVNRREFESLDESRVTVVASGPLTSDLLAADLGRLLGQDNLYFYDAVSPIVQADSLDLSELFLASRYQKGEASYLNSSLTEELYTRFRRELLNAELFPLHPFEETRYFEGCLPIEELAARGEDSLRYGPMKPVGLVDPASGQMPYAVVQMRKENTPGTLYNLVGFQTRLKRGEQERVLRMLPGFQQAVFARYGSIHRNTYIRSPRLLKPTLNLKVEPRIFIGGQLTGVEGYVESIAMGWLAGVNAALSAKGGRPLVPPAQTAIGGLARYILGGSPGDFQPMNINWGLFSELPGGRRNKLERYEALGNRALERLESWKSKVGL
jgi:methylenetetrahydrofolate--tRNA-(uracil-5-)-methyltransferase